MVIIQSFMFNNQREQSTTDSNEMDMGLSLLKWNNDMGTIFVPSKSDVGISQKIFPID